MGVAGHQHVLVTLALPLQFCEETLDVLCHEAQLTADEQLQVHQHLVVATASRVNLLAHVAEPAGEHQLDLRVHVLDAFLYDEPPFPYFREDVSQFGQQLLQFFFLDESDALEHCDVCHRTEHVGLGQVHVHLAVASDGETFDFRRYLISFVPKLHIKVKMLKS